MDKANHAVLHFARCPKILILLGMLEVLYQQLNIDLQMSLKWTTFQRIDKEKFLF